MRRFRCFRFLDEWLRMEGITVRRWHGGCMTTEWVIGGTGWLAGVWVRGSVVCWYGLWSSRVDASLLTIPWINISFLSRASHPIAVDLVPWNHPHVASRKSERNPISMHFIIIVFLSSLPKFLTSLGFRWSFRYSPPPFLSYSQKDGINSFQTSILFEHLLVWAYSQESTLMTSLGSLFTVASSCSMLNMKIPLVI